MLNNSISGKISQTIVIMMVLSALIMLVGSVPVQAQRTQRRASPSRTTPSIGTLENSYTLGGGDRIRIDNVKLPEYSGEYTIPRGGVLSLPLVGTLSLQGLTLEEATQAITTAYSRILKRPRIGVRLIEPRALNIVVSGEVNRPGSYIVPVLDTRTPGMRYPTVTQLIQQAEGVTQTADLSRVQVRRRQRYGSERIINLNLQEFLRTGNPSQDIHVLDGDTIFVPTATNVSLSQSNYVATTSLATDLTKPRTVRVLGEVANAGSYVLTGGNTIPDRNVGGRPTITRAIQVAGGITSASDLRRIQVRRSTKAGTEQIFYVDLWQFLQSGDTNQDLILQDGDTIFVPTLQNITLLQANQLATLSLATDITKPRTVTVIGEVNNPGPYVLIGGETKTDGRTVGGLPTVSRAIQIAGGITQQADIRNIQVRRPTRTGVEKFINVNLWQFLQAGDFSQDLILEEGDTIFIPTAADIEPAEVSQLAGSSLSPNTIQVSVVGEVGRPGRIEVRPDTTLNQALLAAGGFNRSRAKRSSVELIRLNLNGTISRFTVPIDFNQGINEQTNPLLQNNDIIVVGRSGLARVGDTLENVVGGGGLFSIFRILEILGLP